MPNLFPCPNSQCTYQFDADQLPPAAMVTCPLCRTRFPYRARQQAAAAPAGNAPEPMEPRPSGPRVVNLRDRPKGGTVLTTILWVGGFCVVLAAIVAMLALRGRTKVDTPNDAADQTFNIRVEPFPSPWEMDVEAQKVVDGNVLGRKRTGPDAWVSVAAKDFKDRDPRASELDELMRTRLKGGFTSLELETIDGEQWAGKPATAVRFTGIHEEAHMRGEAHMIAHKGIGYVFFAWSAEANWEAVKGEMPGLRDKIQTGKFRESWEPRRANSQVFNGDAFQIEDPDEAWVLGKVFEEGVTPKKSDYPIDDVKAFHPNAVMVLKASYQRREKGDNKRKPAEAQAYVLEIPGGGEPLEAVKSAMIAHIKKSYAGSPPEVKLEVMNRSAAGVTLPTGGPAIGRFAFQDPFSKSDRTVYVLSAISVAGKTIGVAAFATEADASYVEEWMVHLAGSLRAK